MRVVIPTAGIGSRLGNLTKYLNKSLISVANKPVISHIIDGYPDDTEFVIALGHKGNLVREFLELAYPEKKFIFVEIDKFEGEGSGLGYTLLKCKEHLQQPFIFHSCDTLVFNIIPEPTENWMGYTCMCQNIEKYRTINIINDSVVDINKKGHIASPRIKQRPYIGLTGIFDYKEFWEAMEYDDEDVITEGESYGLNILLLKSIRAIEFDWCDTGNPDSLENTRSIIHPEDSPNILEKPDEAIWFIGDKVIKFSENKLFIENRVKRAEILKEYVPKVVASRPNMYSYDKVEGEILSKIITIPIFEKLLDYSKTFWGESHQNCANYKDFQKVCSKFYKDKTYERVDLFYKTFGIEDKEEIINGIKVPTLKSLLDSVEWYKIVEGRAGRFHGDFHFENILYSKNDDKFIFLDWRQDFGGDLEVGDIYYDLAKLNHGLIICHELIAEDMFSVEIDEDKIDYDFHRKQILVECEKHFKRWTNDNGYNYKKIRIMTALIYLNICALHEDPYCKLLYYLGKSMIYEELK